MYIIITILDIRSIIVLSFFLNAFDCYYYYRRTFAGHYEIISMAQSYYYPVRSGIILCSYTIYSMIYYTRVCTRKPCTVFG